MVSSFFYELKVLFFRGIFYNIILLGLWLYYSTNRPFPQPNPALFAKEKHQQRRCFSSI